MSLFFTRLDGAAARAGCMLALAALAITSSHAKEARRSVNDDVVEQIAPLMHRDAGEIITELPPLKPYKKDALIKSAKPVAKSAKPASQEPSTKVETAAEAPPAALPAPEAGAPQQASAPQPASPPVEANAQQPEGSPAREAKAPQAASAPVEAKETAAPVDAAAAAPVAPVPAAAETKLAPVAEASPAAPPADASSAAPESTAATPPAIEAAKPAPQAPAPEAASPAAAASMPQRDNPAEAQQALAPAPAMEQPARQAAAEAPALAATAPTETKPAAALSAARVAAIIESGVKGPAEVRLADRAVYSLPAERIFLPKEKARELVEAAGHQWDEATVGVVLGASTGSEWLAFVDLLDDGYIKDDDASHLDAAKLLEAYKASVAAGNEARARAGAKPLVVTGWIDAPRYDEKHRFVSCVGASSEPIDDPKNGIVNCTSYALGRSGAFKVIVATSVEGYASLTNEASKIAESIVYDAGKGYADADLSKDRIAGYGLAALATGSFAGKSPANAAPRKPDARPANGESHLIDYVTLLIGGLAIVGLVARRAMTKKEHVSAKSPTDTRKPRESDEAKQEPRSILQSLKSKLGGVRKKPVPAAETPVPAAAVTPAAIAQQEEERPASALAKLAALMRKKAPEPTHVPLNPDRLMRQMNVANRVVLQGGAPEPVAVKNDRVKDEAQLAPLSEEHELIEPGAADAEALRARELRRASA
jgi:uncharacterized membrane-anchored protein